jgi:nicotinamide mononucleotide transporter
VVFIVLNTRGLQAWRAGQQVSESAPVFRTTRRELATMLLLVAGMVPLLWWLLGLMKGSAPLIDALVTSLSIVAQWLLNRRVLENWIWWIAVDLISIPLYVSRGLPLIAALYVVFLLICCQGYVRWRTLVAPSPAQVLA